jgi:hypothetical protein
MAQQSSDDSRAHAYRLATTAHHCKAAALVQFFEVDFPAASAHKRRLVAQLLPELKRVRLQIHLCMAFRDVDTRAGAAKSEYASYETGCCDNALA